MENHVIDTAAVLQFIAARASRMSRRDYPGMFAQIPVKRLKLGSHAVHIGEAVQVNERVTVASLEYRNFAAT